MKRFWGILLALVMVFSLVGLMTSASVVQAQTTFTVTNTNDSGADSLRQAILDANTTPGTDTIEFNIPGVGPHTIQPLSPLPTITDSVIIDGYTQLGAISNTNPPGLGFNTVLMIELDGSNAGFGAEGLRITAGSSIVRGLVINRFSSGNGIGLETNGQNVIEGNFIGTDVIGTNAFPSNRNLYGLYISGSSTNNTIGGTTVAAGNLISGNDASGVRLSTQNVVQGNFIGTDVTGTTDLGNAMGVSVGGSTNTIGGTTVAAGNIISGNAWVGIDMTAGPIGNLVQGNFIGTDVTGTTALGNGSSGVRISNASGNTIGGTIAGAGNVISGNNGSGVEITGGATSNLMQGNFIGTDVTGTTALGNSGPGVSIRGSNNMVGGTANGAGNTIAFNGGEGVYIIPFFGLPSTGNVILSNSIHSNASLGIDLGDDGVTPNDSGDSDTGANNLQNYPVLTSATSGSSITIEGTLNSTPDTEFKLEYFYNSACDPSGFGEGETFLGFTNVITNGSADVTFTATFPSTVPAGHSITATATDPDGNTSEFSQCVEVVATPSEVWVDDDYAPGEYNNGHTWGYDAFAKIQDGIDTVAASIVHVAAGYYVENITLEDGVQVLGAGADITTIDGGGAGSVVSADSVGSETVLDGFTITGGNATNGGGMYNNESSPTVTNCKFSNNSAWDGGGGIFNHDSSPTLIKCTFSDNSAGWGGGMYNGESSPMVIDCTFNSNTAINGGGGMYNHDYSSAMVTNCILSNNSSTMGWGGGMHNHKSPPTVINCTFFSNSGGGMLNWDSSPTITNCILWDDGYEISNDANSTPLVTYCDVQGGYPDDHNISEDPMFIDPAGDDFHLKIGSPCIDNGTDVGAPTEDIEGNLRPIDGDGDSIAITDMGAYEYVPSIIALEAIADFNPDTLNLKSKGKVVTVYIELPEGYDVEKTDISTVMLNGIVPALRHPTDVGDYDSDGVPDLMVKFNRSDVQDVLEPGNEVEVTVSGQLINGTPFEGTDTIRVIDKGKK